eukprot:g5150.t1
MECICMICTCGKHFCPVHKDKPLKFEARTTANDNFKAWEAQPRTAPRVQQTYTPNTAKFYGETTSAAAHQAHEICPVVRIQRPVQSAAVSDAPFDGRTTASDNFKAWEAQPRAAPRVQQTYTPNTAKFYGETT